MNYCNINIKSRDKLYTYAIGYEKGNTSLNYPCYYVVDNDVIYIVDDDVEYYRDVNSWSGIKSDFENIKPVNLSKCDLININLLFPLHSIEVYDKYIKYAINLILYIGNKKIDLGTKILSRIDALATDKVIKKYNNTYMEHIGISVVNPNFIMYSDEFASFRQENNINTTDEGGVLGVSLFPVEYDNDTNKYYIKSGYTEGQNSINISGVDDYLRLHLSHNIFENDRSKLTCKVIYNDNYDNLVDYIRQTYFLNNFTLKYEIIIKDNINKLPLKLLNKETSNEELVEFNLNELYLPNQDSDGNIINYSSSISICASLNIENNDDGNIVLYLLSNEIPLTDNIIGYFIEKDIEQINLQDLTNMNVININTVNKTVNNIVKINGVDNSKSNIIQPVFFRTEPLYNIIVHPDITENLCINLDSYKSKVEYFMIRIEGISFSEIGRTNSGVVFKISGNQLPQSVQSGTYYIMDQDSNVITNGKYNYEY